MKKENITWLLMGMCILIIILLLGVPTTTTEAQYTGSSSDQLAQRISYDGSDRIQYVGECYTRFQNQGNTLAWRIKRLAYDGATTRIVSILWANRTIEFELAWNLRATYAY